MEIEKTKIEGVLIMTPTVYVDERGYFFESFNQKQCADLGVTEFVQDNESQSAAGVLRGLHYQLPPYEQGKLVRVVSGSILDVAVDIRPDSPTLGEYVAVKLDDEQKQQLWIPPGLAHGFLSLADDTIINYKCTNYYDQSSELGIKWNDATLGIDWGVAQPILSEKDEQQSSFEEVMTIIKKHKS